MRKYFSLPSAPEMPVTGMPLVRSVTEPLITLRFEAETGARLKEIVEEVAQKIPELRDKLGQVAEEP